MASLSAMLAAAAPTPARAWRLAFAVWWRTAPESRSRLATTRRWPRTALHWRRRALPHIFLTAFLRACADALAENPASADLVDAKLDLANLSGANLRRANLDGASLSGANLNGVTGLNRTFGVARYSATTDFSNTGFDPVAAGWRLVDDPSSHTSALLHVPEPTISILFAIGGLIGLLQAGNRASRQR